MSHVSISFSHVASRLELPIFCFVVVFPFFFKVEINSKPPPVLQFRKKENTIEIYQTVWDIPIACGVCGIFSGMYSTDELWYFVISCLKSRDFRHQAIRLVVFLFRVLILLGENVKNNKGSNRVVERKNKYLRWKMKIEFVEIGRGRETHDRTDWVARIDFLVPRARRQRYRHPSDSILSCTIIQRLRSLGMSVRLSL